MPKYYTDLRIPVYNFHKILETNDNKYLWVDEVGEEDLTEGWREIYNLYCKEADIDNTNIITISRIEFLKDEHSRLSKLVDMLEEDVFDSVTAEIKKSLLKFNYAFDEKKTIKENVIRFRKSLDSKMMKIRIEQKKLPKEDKKQAKNLMSEIVSLQRITEIKINIYNDSMEYFLAVNNEAKNIVKERKRLNNG